jgi:hypothetical protein
MKMRLGPENIRLAEHFAFHSPWPLEDLCTAVQRHFGLPEFEYDAENETEWGSVVHDGLEYNFSCPYEDGTLQAWDSSVPFDCNVGFTLSVSRDRHEPRDAEHSSTGIVSVLGQALADLFGQAVHHHRTWLGPGENIERTRLFRPGPHARVGATP